MTCNDVWTFRFPDVPGDGGPFEIRPTTMNFQRGWSDLPYVRAKFQPEVGDAMRPHTRYNDGRLREPTRVEVLYDGEPVHILYFKPDFARYESNYTHLEFHGLQWSLDTGTIDKNWTTVKLREAYEYIWEHSPEGLLEGIRFAVPDEVEQELLGEAPGFTDAVGGIRELRGLFGNVNREIAEAIGEVQTIEADNTRRLIDSYYAIDLQDATPVEALTALNRKFGVVNWVDLDGYLWVGIPEAFAEYHVAAPDDTRVWRYSGNGVNITHPREPIQQVTVVGAWVDEPGVSDTDATIDMYSGGEAIEGGERTGSVVGDVRVNGIAYRTDIDYGESILLDRPQAKRDAVAPIAETQLKRSMREGNQGSIEINADLSGDFTSLEQAKPGDFVHVVPSDDHFDGADITARTGEVGEEPDDLGRCDAFVNNEVYLITKVQHDIDDSGYWSTSLDVTMYPDDPIESAVRYFDPRSQEYQTEEDLFGGDD